MNTFRSILGALGLFLLAGLLVGGCGGGAGAGAEAFASANAEAKAMWDQGLTAAKAKDYATALMTFQRLHARTDLTPDQIKAVEQTATSVSDQMYEAANNGDAEAAKAIEALRKAHAR